MAADWQPRRANAWSPKDDYPLKLQLGLPRVAKEWSFSAPPPTRLVREH